MRAVLVSVFTEGDLRFVCSQKRLPVSLVNKMEMIIALKLVLLNCTAFTYRHGNGSWGEFQLPHRQDNLFFFNIDSIQNRPQA